MISWGVSRKMRAPKRSEAIRTRIPSQVEWAMVSMTMQVRPTAFPRSVNVNSAAVRSGNVLTIRVINHMARKPMAPMNAMAYNAP